MRHPDRQECERLLNEYNTPEHVKRHCRAVADMACTVAEELNKHGFGLDTELVLAAGLLHDIARVEDRHWDVGADLMDKLGYHEEAKIIKVHMTYSPFSDIKNVKLVENSLPIPEIVESLLIKSEVWQYEEEWRIICFLKNLNEQKLVENMISKVYLGANINEENEKLISELAKAKEVPVEKFKVSPETFELKIQIDLY